MRIIHLSFGRSIVCGVAPLLTGIAVFRVWERTRWAPLLMAGVAIIALGVVASVAGTVYFARDQRSHGSWSPASRARAALAGALLVACYPAAFWLTREAMELQTSYTVEIRNEAPETLTSCRLQTTRIDAEVGPIAPGESASRRLKIQADGELRCLVRTSAGTRHRILVEGYVTPSLGGDARLTFGEQGNPILERR